MEKFVNYYEILGVSKDASMEDIKKAYRELSKKYHPDSHPGIDDTLQKQVNEAYECLKKEDKKAEYDKKLAAQERKEAERKAAEEAARQQQAWNDARSYAYQGANYQQQNFYYGQHTQNNGQTRKRTHQTSGQASSNNSSKYTRSRYEKGQFEYDRRKRNERGRYEAKHEKPTTMKKFVNDIKQAWKEVREEEKKMPFVTRHTKLNGKIYREFHKRNSTAGEEFIYAMKNGTLHIFFETFYQLQKLSHITEDSIPKFVIRNRNVLATALAATILITGAGLKSEDVPVQTQQPAFSTQMPQSDNMGLGQEIIDDNQIVDNSYKENQSYKIYRIYTVQPNDTLSELAEDANSSVEELRRVNDLDSTLIRIGETLYIPYNIEPGDLRYATVAAYYPAGMSLEDFAERYATDAYSIMSLNEEALENGKVISDTLLVPTFASQREIREQKEAASAKTYTRGQ